jgi:RNA polymerase primary sigma factor
VRLTEGYEKRGLLTPLEEFALAMRRADAIERVLDSVVRTQNGVRLLIAVAEQRNAVEEGKLEVEADDLGLGAPVREWLAKRLALLATDELAWSSFLSPSVPLPSERRAVLSLGRRMALTVDETYELAAEVSEAAAKAVDADSDGESPARAVAQQVGRAVSELTAVRNELVCRNVRLTWPLARERLGGGLELNELAQAGTIGLMRGADRFDWSRGTRFSTYAVHWIRQAVQRAIDNEGATIRLPVHLGALAAKVRKALRNAGPEETLDAEALAVQLKEPVRKVEAVLRHLRPLLRLDQPASPDGEATLGTLLPSHQEGVAEIAERAEEAGLLAREVARLPNRTALILRKRFGLLGEREHTLEEIGKELGCTRERVRQIESQALELLEKRLRVLGLAEFSADSEAQPRPRRNARARKVS